MFRRCKAIAWINQKNEWIEGAFHGWSQDYEELRDGVGISPVAIVEVADGRIYLCHATSVQFIDLLPQLQA